MVKIGSKFSLQTYFTFYALVMHKSAGLPVVGYLLKKAEVLKHETLSRDLRIECKQYICQSYLLRGKGEQIFIIII